MRSDQQPTVSIITPTYRRERHLKRLGHLVESQRYPRLEWLIMDDTEGSFQPSWVDPRSTRYLCSSVKLPLGEKRNILIDAAQGDVIVHFDDDDYYAPCYVDEMIRHLGESDLVKLSGWFVMHCSSQSFYYWDTTEVHPVHFKVGQGPPVLIGMNRLGQDRDLWRLEQMWGYGFSYAFKRRLWNSGRFPSEVTHKEDTAFITAALARGAALEAVADRRGLAVHMMHSDNTAAVFPNYRLPFALSLDMLGPAFASYVAGEHTDTSHP